MTERRDARNKPTARFMMRRTKTRHPHPRARSSSALSPLQAHTYIHVDATSFATRGETTKYACQQRAQNDVSHVLVR